tara:strand:+ start:2246 stop:2923 length:678 start_codon:yes stop_codon:yes gene_type:complete
MANLKTYLGFEDIPVYNFYKIAETGDMRWFYKKFRSNKDIEVSENDIFILSERYKEVYSARVKYTNDVKSIEYYRKLVEISDLETKLFRIQSAFNVLTKIELDNKFFKEYVEYFAEYEFYIFEKEINTEKIRIEYLEWLQIKIKGFSTKVKVRKALYKDILEPEKITEENAKFDSIREKILLQEALSLSIDIYTCPLIEWCAMIIRAEEKAVQAKKEVDKIKNKR